MAKRNYQDIIFTGYDSVIVTYADVLQAKISTPRGDKETNRALVIGAPGGGAVFPGLDWYANKFTEVGYVFAEFDPGQGSEFDQIAHGGCMNRFMHKNHLTYGVSGSKFFNFGVSLGGSNGWAQTIVLEKILTDPKFASPVNSLYPKAKMALKGSASMSGGVTDNIYKFIDGSSKPHLDSHGDQDKTLDIKKSKAAIDQMNLMGVRSRLDTYPNAGHGLDGLHEIIIQKIFVWFAELMKLPIVPVTAPS